MRIETSQYEFTHGRKPKGFGMWMFDVKGIDGRGAYATERYSVTGLLTEARKQAARRFKNERGAVMTTEIVILP